MRYLCQTDDEDQTRAVGVALAGSLWPDGVLLLRGEMGSGKTVLTQGVARGLGISEREIQSPTFTLMREHRGSGDVLIHIDLYRLEGPEIEAIGLWETLGGPGVKAVEWSERLTYEIPDAIRVALKSVGTGTRRELEIETPAENPELRHRLAEVEVLCE